MAFKLKQQNTSNNSNNESQVDWKSYHKHIVETADCELEQTLRGVVSGIIDLGMQAQEDAEMVFNGTAEDEAEAIKQHPATYFKDGQDPKTKKPARMKCWPQKPAQCVTITVDFPDVMLDHSLYLTGESNPKPMRLYLGGQFYFGQEMGMKVARPISLKQKTNEAGVWCLPNTHTLHKMAAGAKLLNEDGTFKASDIDKLIGQTLQFKVQIFIKKVGDKEYLTEKVAYVSGLTRGVSACEWDGTPFIISTDDENDPEALAEVRKYVINTIKQATDYDKSAIKAQIEAMEASKASQKDAPAETPAKETPTKEAPKPVKSKAAQKAVPTPAADEDDNIPF